MLHPGVSGEGERCVCVWGGGAALCGCGESGRGQRRGVDMGQQCWGLRETPGWEWDVVAVPPSLTPTPPPSISTGLFAGCLPEGQRTVLRWGAEHPRAPPHLLPTQDVPLPGTGL